MEGETVKEERKEEAPIDKEKDNLPNKGIIDKKVTEEAPGLRRRVNVQTVSVSSGQSMFIMVNVVSRKMSPPLYRLQLLMKSYRDC